MPKYVALLRAVNVGGTAKLPMTHLKSMCTQAGFTQVQTYIASGNVVFHSAGPANQIKAALEARLLAYFGKPVGVFLRTQAEMQAVLTANPFPNAEPSRAVVIFLDQAPPADALTTITGRQDEVVTLGTREIYVHYPSGIGASRLKIPAAANGTARNLNTVEKLARL